MGRPAARALAAAGLAAGGLLAAGCSQGGLGLAQQACVHVHRSIALYARSQRDPNSAPAARDRRLALAQLQVAEPLAAAANSEDGSWNGLMTTLTESARVPESELVVALRSQCSEAGTAGGPPAVTGPTIPPGLVTGAKSGTHHPPPATGTAAGAGAG